MGLLWPTSLQFRANKPKHPEHLLKNKSLWKAACLDWALTHKNHKNPSQNFSKIDPKNPSFSFAQIMTVKNGSSKKTSTVPWKKTGSPAELTVTEIYFEKSTSKSETLN